MERLKTGELDLYIGGLIGGLIASIFKFEWYIVIVWVVVWFCIDEIININRHKFRTRRVKNE